MGGHESKSRSRLSVEREARVCLGQGRASERRTCTPQPHLYQAFHRDPCRTFPSRQRLFDRQMAAPLAAPRSRHDSSNGASPRPGRARWWRGREAAARQHNASSRRKCVSREQADLHTTGSRWPVALGVGLSRNIHTVTGQHISHTTRVARQTLQFLRNYY